MFSAIGVFIGLNTTGTGTGSGGGGTGVDGILLENGIDFIGLEADVQFKITLEGAAFWILASGFWNDSGIWDSTSLWID
jgi:hypothetical protein